MTHRSPLVTLAGLVVAFALFFGINLASSAPRQATGAEYSSASPSASPADQTSETPSPSTTGPATATATATRVQVERRQPNQRVTSSRTRWSTPDAPTMTARRLLSLS